MTRKFIFWGLCILLVFLPLPLGSVLEWAVFAFEAAVIILLLLYVLGTSLEKKRTGREMKNGPGVGEGLPETGQKLPVVFKVLALVYVSFSIIQLLPLPPALLRLLSPRTHGILARLAEDGLSGRAAGAWHALSFNPAASLGKFILILCIGVFGFLILRCVRTRREMETMVLVIIAGGLFQAFYGMAEMFSGHEMIFGLKKRSIGSVTGTYFNRNHFAGFLEMVFPISLGYVLVKSRYFMMERDLTFREKVLWFSQEKLQWTFLYGLSAIFIGTGLVFSSSRSGVTILLLTIILAAVLAGEWRDISEGPGRTSSRKVIRIVAGLVLAVSVWIGLGPVLARFSSTDISAEVRRVFYRNAVEMIRDHPFAGTGQGTFVDAYDMYEKFDDGVKISYAHNDYLEAAAENGLPAGVALMAIPLGLAVLIAIRWRRRRDNFAKGVGLGCLLALVALLVHGLTDFNFQIPANAAYFAAIAALGFNVVTRPGRGRWKSGQNCPSNGADGLPGGSGVEAPRKSGELPGPGRSIRMAAVVVPALAALIFSARDFIGYKYLEAYQRARSAARSVESEFPRLEPLLLRSIQSSPRTEYRIELARLYGEMAQVANGRGDEEGRDGWCDKSIERYGEALRADPIRAYSYYETGMIYLMINYPLMTYMDKAESYLRTSIELKPADVSLNLSVIFIHMTSWANLGPEDKTYVSGLFRRMNVTDVNFADKLRKRWRKSYGDRGKEQFENILAELISAPSGQPGP